MTTRKALKWAYRNGMLGAEEFPGLNEAIQAAVDAFDDDLEGLEAIEVIEEGQPVQRLSYEDVWAIVHARLEELGLAHDHYP